MTDVIESSEASSPENTGKGEDVNPSSRLPGFLNSPLIAGGIVVVMTCLVFFSVLGFSFTNFDDVTNITGNPHFNPVTPKSIAYFWTHGYYELYMPVTYTVWGICATLFSLEAPLYVPGGGNTLMNPAVFHGTSLFLHVANAVLVFTLLYRLIRRPWAACIGALLFALHPMQTEPVAWITGMNNLTSGFFGLLALNLYVAAAGGSSTGNKMIRPSYLFATGFFILSLLSKPTAAALPLVAAVLDGMVLRRPFKQWIPLIAPWVLLSIGIAVITMNTSDTSYVNLPLWARPIIAGDALFIYLGKLLLPLRTSINSGRSMNIVLGNWWGYVTWIVPAAVAAAIWFFGKNAHLLRAGAVIFVAALVPMLGFVPTYGMMSTTVCDRYLYLPLIGAGLGLAWFAGSARIWTPQIRYGVCGIILALFTVRTLYQLPIWNDTYTLSKAQIAINPRDAESQTNYAISLAEKGLVTEALEHFKNAVSLKPDRPIYQYHLGTALEDSGDVAGAAPALREAVRLDPRFTLAHIRLGGVLLKLGQNSEAIEPLRKAVEIAPNDPSAGYLLGIALAAADRLPEAEAQFRRVLTVSSEMPQARQALGRVLEKQGRLKEAALVYQEILKSAPEDPQAQEGLERSRSGTKQP